MNAFLPEGYERPAASGGNYAKLEDGANKFRILSNAVVGWVYWSNENKPIRVKHKPEVLPDDIRYENGKPDKVKHFWAFVVWSYRENRVQILEVTQASIQGPLEDLVVIEEWGDPRGYDITITKKGQKLDTEYTLQPSPHKPISEDIKAEFESKKLNLDALFDGNDPFNGTNTVADTKADEEYAAMTEKPERPASVKGALDARDARESGATDVA